MPAQAEARMVRVWDPLVRIGHWVLVAGFATAYLTEGEPEWLHSWAGYAVAATVALRVVWGFVGPRRARFADFVTGPGRAFAYLRDLATGRARRHLGHSPAGGLMTLALLASLALTAVTGMATLAAEEGRGPLSTVITRQSAALEAPGLELPALVARAHADSEAGEHGGGEHGEGEDDEGEDDEQESLWKEAHELLANLTLALVILHLGGVALASLAHRENLPRAMVTGLKRS